MLAEQTIIKEKVCSICNETKKISEFNKDKLGTGGRRGECQSCRKKKRVTGDYIRERFRRHGARNGGEIEYTDDLIVRIRLAKTCQYCGCRFINKPQHSKQLTIDHVYNAKINTDYNSALVCRSCNASKGTRPIYEFYTSTETFTDELYIAFLKDFHNRILKRDFTQEDITFLIDWSKRLYEAMKKEDKTMSEVACLYLVEEYLGRWYSKTSYERQNKAGISIPILKDGVAYVDEIFGRYRIRNSDDEILFIVDDEPSLLREIKRLKAKKMLIDGVEIDIDEKKGVRIQ